MALFITKIVNKKGCFDLQFRRDVKYKRPNKPIYYSWKAQFIIVGRYQDENVLRKIQSALGSGRLHFLSSYSRKRRERRGQSPLRLVAENKIRYSVQNIEDLHDKVVPFLKENKLAGNKKQDFEWWARAVEILFKNKGKEIKKWEKEDFFEVIEIQKKMQKYKSKKTQSQKWISVAKSIFLYPDKESKFFPSSELE